jgi:hypothetical protein
LPNAVTECKDKGRRPEIEKFGSTSRKRRRRKIV